MLPLLLPPLIPILGFTIVIACKRLGSIDSLSSLHLLLTHLQCQLSGGSGSNIPIDCQIPFVNLSRI